MLYLISIMSTKIAILILYKTLFGIKRSFRYLCYGMMAIVTSYCIIFFFIEAFNCNPVAKTWHALTFTGPAKCFDNSMIQFVIGGFNIATDFIILVMPMPIILDLNMDSKRKIGLLVIFSTGILYVVFASVEATQEVLELTQTQCLRFDDSARGHRGADPPRLRPKLGHCAGDRVAVSERHPPPHPVPPPPLDG